MNPQDLNQDKSVQVPTVLIPLFKRISQEYKRKRIKYRLSPIAAADAIASQWDSSEKFNSELNSDEHIQKIREVVQRYKTNKRATRDWTQAARLIDELSELLKLD